MAGLAGVTSSFACPPCASPPSSPAWLSLPPCPFGVLFGSVVSALGRIGVADALGRQARRDTARERSGQQNFREPFHGELRLTPDNCDSPPQFLLDCKFSVCSKARRDISLFPAFMENRVGRDATIFRGYKILTMLDLSE
ncbi:MAG: hypothetical protein K2Z80_01810 [Xanthobacteraceae bacterium]|nr:hypothetical protein [Xanthobacteraceae bacterium]